MAREQPVSPRSSLGATVSVYALVVACLLGSLVLVGIVGSLLTLAGVPSPAPAVILSCLTLVLGIGQGPIVYRAGSRSSTVLPKSRRFAVALLASSSVLVTAAALIAGTL